MRTITTLLLTLFYSSICFAQITVSDLPFIEGTPLEYSDETASDWSILDYQENDAGYAWIWLQNASQHAYLVYPSGVTEASLTFPDGTKLAVVAERVNLSFIGEPEQRVELTRFGGKITLDGAFIHLSYTPTEMELTYPGNEYHLTSNNQLDVSFKAFPLVSEGDLAISGDLSIDAPGGNVIIIGTVGDDSFTIDVSSTIQMINGSLGDDLFIFTPSESSEAPQSNNLCGGRIDDPSSATISSGLEQQASSVNLGSNLCISTPINLSLEHSINLRESNVFTLIEPAGVSSITTSERKKRSWAGATNDPLITFMLLLLWVGFKRRVKNRLANNTKSLQ